jgi:small conductance mechanosensitive channel
MALSRYRSCFITFVGTLCLCFLLHLPSTAQSPTPAPSVFPPPTVPALQQPFTFINSSSLLFSDWIWLDGHRLFQIAATKGNLSERQQTVQDNLHNIQQNYLKSDAIDPQVEIRSLNNLPVIYVNQEYLLSITSLDADLRSVESSALASEIQSTLETALKRSREEHQLHYLRQKGIITAAILVGLLIISGVIYFWQKRLTHKTKTLAPVTLDSPPPLLRERLGGGFNTLLRQALTMIQVALWFGGLLISLDQFPYTRPFKVWILKSLTVPLTLVLVSVCTYLTIRLSWTLVNRFALALTVSPLLTPLASRRIHLRISTIANVIKGIAVPVWGSIGIIVALILLKVNVGPLLAGVGLIGVALSLASQSIIKDAINGFLVILEDQFGVGDVIVVGNFSGIVETLNLRITQIRNAEGQLITIPNSEIRIVANLSSEWSRVDLNIPIPYTANVDQMLDLIQSTAISMAEEPDWQPHILDTPELMGIDDFDHRGLIVKIWIKTQPLQQWAVSRELRRRLKLAFDQANISIPVPQHSLWIYPPET